MARLEESVEADDLELVSSSKTLRCTGESHGSFNYEYCIDSSNQRLIAGVNAFGGFDYKFNPNYKP